MKLSTASNLDLPNLKILIVSWIASSYKSVSWISCLLIIKSSVNPFSNGCHSSNT